MENVKFKAVATTAFSEVFALRPNRYGESSWPATIGRHTRVVCDPRAEFAMVCIEKWGMVAATSDGEDSSGRAKLRGLTPQEVVTKACDVAGLAFERFKELGWTTAVPSMQELVDTVKEQENGND